MPKIVPIAKKQPTDIFDERKLWPNAGNRIQEDWKPITGISLPTLITYLAEWLARGPSDDYVGPALVPNWHTKVKRHLIATAVKVRGIRCGWLFLHFEAVGPNARSLEAKGKATTTGKQV